MTDEKWTDSLANAMATARPHVRARYSRKQNIAWHAAELRRLKQEEEEAARKHEELDMRRRERLKVKRARERLFEDMNAASDAEMRNRREVLRDVMLILRWLADREEATDV